VAATTQSWIEALNSRDPERGVALYDPEAVLWGTVSPALHDTPASIRDYFKVLPGFAPQFKVLSESSEFGSAETRRSTAARTRSQAFETGSRRRLPLSVVYRNRDGRWHIVDHHSSALPSPPQ
jgi:hypothetical protein